MSAAIVVHINRQRRSLALRGSTSIGRSELCTLRIESRLVSRQHTLIEGSDDRWFIQDLGSRNGTWVNGERLLARRQLRPRDAITIGEAKIVFVPTPLLFPSLAPERQGENGHAEVLFRCGNCRQKLRSPFYLSLSLIRCPRCRSRLIVPALAEEWDLDEAAPGPETVGPVVEGVTGLEMPSAHEQGNDVDLDLSEVDEEPEAGIEPDAIDEFELLEEPEPEPDFTPDAEPESLGGGDRAAPPTGVRVIEESAHDAEPGVEGVHDSQGPRVGGSSGASVMSRASSTLAARVRAADVRPEDREADIIGGVGLLIAPVIAPAPHSAIARSLVASPPAAVRVRVGQRAADAAALGPAARSAARAIGESTREAAGARVGQRESPAARGRAVRVALTQRAAGQIAPPRAGARVASVRAGAVADRAVTVDVGSRPSGSGLFDLVPNRAGGEAPAQDAPGDAATGSPPPRVGLEEALKVGGEGRNQTEGYWASLAAGKAASRPRVRNVLLAARALRNVDDVELRTRLAALPGLFRLGKVLRQQVDDAMALACEAMRRAGPAHAPAGQVAGALAMEAGCIAVLPPPGDGSIALALAAALAGYRGAGCHIFCASDADAEQFARVHQRFFQLAGLKSAHVTAAMPIPARRAAYAADVTCATAETLMQDLLRDRRQSAPPSKSGFFRAEPTPEPPVIRGLAYAILHDASATLGMLGSGEARPGLAAGRGVHQLVRQYKRVRGLTRGDGAMRRELWSVYKVPVVPVARLRR